MHDVEDIYPLSPLQRGFLFHSLYAPEAGEHLLQITCTLNGPLDVARFQTACAHVVAAHPALRTSFAWDELDEPLQVVRRAVAPALVQLDWQDLDAEARRRALAAFLADDRRRGFALDRPPLLRWAVARTAPDQHVLAWTCHHLLVDGWSLALVLGQCLSAYDAIVRGQPPAAVVARPYRDYIAWLPHQPVALAERYWRARLAGFRAPTPLPLARAIRRDAGTAPRSQRRVLGGSAPTPAHDRSFEARLGDFTRAHAITPSSFFQAIWAILLARYTGERDVVFGTTVAGRPAQLAGVEAMVGMFVNTIPVRVDVAPELAVVDWMRRLQGEAAEAREFEHASLSQIHGWSELARGAPMFETLFVYENFPAIGGAGPGGVEVADAETHDVTSFALDIDVIPGPPYTILATYARDRHDDATVARILDHIEHTAEQILAHPAARLRDVSTLPDAEATTQLVTWNARRADYPITRSITALLEDTVRRTPDRVAVAHRGAQLTYRALDAAANRVAHALIVRGVRTDTIVGLLADRDPSLLIAIAGILKAGGAYLPLDRDHPPERIAQIVTQARAPLVVVGAAHERLVTAALARLAPEARPGVVGLDALLDAPAQPAPPPAHGGASLAYVIFTSGSTGAPTGAMLEHGGKINHLLAMVDLLGLGADDIVAQTASQCFDLSVWQLLAPLVIGARVEIFDTELLADPARFLAHVEQTGATVVEAVPSVVANLLHELERRGDARPPLPALRWMIPTAEAVPPALYRRWLRLYPDHRMANAYGPTEAHDVAALFVVDAPPGDADERVPIGAGLPNIRLYLCDEQLSLLPIGMAGELCIGGAAVGRGYVHDPARTAAVFLPDPFAGTPGARLYRTGDRCRYRDDGSLEFLERCDFQVKIHGHRIDPADIESAVARHAGVKQCVVAAIGPDRDKLVAYLVPEDLVLDAPRTVRPLARDAAAAGSPGSPDALAASIHAHLQQHLPRYMMPSAYVVLPGLPVNPNGKIDRRALPSPDPAPPPPPTAAPRTPIEIAIAQIWAAVLDRPVGLDDDFFELGGHSLIVIRVQSRLRQAFQLDLPLRTLFELPTVRQLAARIEAIRWATEPAAAAPGDDDIEI
jgi:amino acid adenylation domain-containing protein